MREGQEGQIPRQSRAGGPRQAGKAPRPGVWSLPEPQLHLLPGQVSWDSILARVSVNPAAASVQPQGMRVGGSVLPPVSQQQAQMSPRVAGPGREARLALAPCAGSGRQSRNEGTWALHGRGRVTTPGTPGWSRAGTVPLSHCPLLGTATSSPAPGLLTIPAAAAPGSASGKSSCQIRRC